MITVDLRHAIAAALADLGLAEPGASAAPDPRLRPGGEPGRYASSLPFRLAAAAGTQPGAVAEALAGRLGAEPWIAEAAVTGTGYLTITVTPDALAAVGARIAAAGPACASSDLLRGERLPAPPSADPLQAPGWEEARATLAAQLTARLAAAAGATVTALNYPERTRGSTPGSASAPAGESGVADSLRAAEPLGAGTATGQTGAGGGGSRVRSGKFSGAPGAGERGGEPGRSGAVAPAADGGRTGGGGQAASGALAGHAGAVLGGDMAAGRAVAAAAEFAGADAVRFALARAAPGRAVRIDPAIIARHVPDNPAYAVRYAHARAASAVRWAAARGAGECGALQGSAEEARPPADPASLALLDALSWLPERVAVAARRGRPDEFARYLEDLASLVTAALGFRSNLCLARAARTGLAAGLRLLGVSAPDRL